MTGMQEADTMAWRVAYERSLSEPRGWWAASGLVWLDEGTHEVGTAPGAAARLTGDGPARLATLSRVGDDVTVVPEPGVELSYDGAPMLAPLTVEASTSGHAFVSGPHTMVILRRQERVGVRLFDARRAGRLETHRVAWFPWQASLVVEATFVPSADVRTLPVVHVTGDVADVAVPGHLEFRLHGRACRLTPFASQAGLHIVFRDATSGTCTYGAGRFLSASAPVEGRVMLDFNRAYHPPCAHTPYATCPLPPLENRIELAIAGGERSP
jgi:uncharacterized protein